MANGFALNRDKMLQIYFFWVKGYSKKFLKDVESRVVLLASLMLYTGNEI